AAIGAGGLEDVALEAAELGALHAGVQLTQKRAAGEVVADFQVIAGGEECRIDRHVDMAAVAEQADLEALLRQSLAKEGAAELAIAIIQADDRVAADQGCAKPLF